MIRLVLTLQFVVCGVVACTAPQPVPSSSGTVPDLEARSATADAYPSGVIDRLHINDDVLTVDEILEAMHEGLLQAARQGDDAYQAHVVNAAPRTIAARVQDILVYQAASRGMDTAQMNEAVGRAVDQEIRRRVTSDYGGRQSRFEAALRNSGRNLRDVRHDVRRELLVTRYMREAILPKISSPTRQELLSYYQEHIGDFSQPAVRELHLIDIPFDNDRDGARQRIDQAQHRVIQGEAFADVARSLSLGIKSSEGGAWGNVTSDMHGRYAVVSTALAQLESQELSVVEGQDAFFIVKAGTVNPAVEQAFIDIQPQLTERYRDAQFEFFRRTMLATLIEEAVIVPSEQEFMRAVVQQAGTADALLRNVGE
jgi:hypothetical protein